MKNQRTAPAWFGVSGVAAAVLALPCAAQDSQGRPEEAAAESPVVITATRLEQPSFDLPVAIDSIGKEQIQETARLGVGISEQLNRVPGTYVQNRESYAQEQQIIIRGFGARSSFGTRGVKLLADGIPAGTPDGQGSPGLFDLDSAERIEVLRGPFSALYGNHSGGVVQVFTEDGPARPTIGVTGMGGSWGTWKGGLKFGGTSESGLNYIGAASTFYTDGYREHSQARKDQFNGKLRSDLAGGGNLSFVVNWLNQPDNQDPLGLTAAQMEQDRRQAGDNAVALDTRRSLDNLQGGLVFEQPLGSRDTVRVMAYIGQRNNDGFLGVPVPTAPAQGQNNVRNSGAVTVLSRDFGGIWGRWTHKNELAGGPLTLQAGADYDVAQEARKGYLNFTGPSTAPTALGVQGALKRNEDNTVDSLGGYLQAEWEATRWLSLSAGLRYTTVSFDSDDHFICTTALNTTGTPLGTCSGSPQAVSATVFNPDDSGSQDYSAWTPVFGALFKLNPALNLYANVGRSFETPTFIELAYRPDGQSGLNFDLNPAISTHYEVGAKWYVTPRTRIDFALFYIDTQDEIVVATNSGGRVTYQNAPGTERTGVELALNSVLGNGFSTYVAATYIDATFTDGFLTCTTQTCTTPNTPVSAGNTIPGVPDYVLAGDLSWASAGGFTVGLEARFQGRVYVNDLNTASADPYMLWNVRAGLEQRRGRWRFTEFARVDNIFSEEYVGAIAVNDVNGRYYFPAPTATLLVGATAAYRF